MVDFLFLILAGVGLTFILADSSIIRGLKYKMVFREDENGIPQKRWVNEQGGTTRFGWFVDKFVEMLNCHQCCGFWSGMVVFGLYYFDVYFLLWGFVVSLMAMFFFAVYSYISNAVAMQEYVLEEEEDEHVLQQKEQPPANHEG